MVYIPMVSMKGERAKGQIIIPGRGKSCRNILRWLEEEG
jgi:hypothetical protein